MTQMQAANAAYEEKLNIKRGLLERICNLTRLLEKHLAGEDMDSFQRTLKLRQTCISQLDPAVPEKIDASPLAQVIREELQSLVERSEALTRAVREKKGEFARRFKGVKTAQKTMTTYDGAGQYVAPQYFDTKK